MAINSNIWVVTLRFRYSDVSFQFNDAEQAVIFAQSAGDSFAPQFSDYYCSSPSEFSVRIQYVSAAENEQKNVEYEAAMNPEPKE